MPGHAWPGQAKLSLAKPGQVWPGLAMQGFAWLSLAKRAGGLALLTRKITPQGLAAAVAWSAAEELARRGAGKLSDRLDEHIEASAVVLVRRSSRTALLLACRDLVMGLLPLLVLALLPALM